MKNIPSISNRFKGLKTIKESDEGFRTAFVIDADTYASHPVIAPSIDFINLCSSREICCSPRLNVCTVTVNEGLLDEPQDMANVANMIIDMQLEFEYAMNQIQEVVFKDGDNQESFMSDLNVANTKKISGAVIDVMDSYLELHDNFDQMVSVEVNI